MTDLSCGCGLLASCTRPATQEDLLCDLCRAALQPSTVHLAPVDTPGPHHTSTLSSAASWAVAGTGPNLSRARAGADPPETPPERRTTEA